MGSINLAIVVPYIPPTYIGGGETYIYYLSKELANLGVNISLFTAKLPPQRGEWNWQHVDLYECKSIFNVGNTPIMPSLPLRMLKNNNWEIIHTAVPSGFACDISALISSIRKVPLVVLYHCDLVDSTAVSKAYSSVLRRYTLKHADRVIATTSSYAKTSSLLRQLTDKVRVIPMGTNLTGYSSNAQEKQEIKGRYGINHNEKVVLFVGGLGHFHKFKRVDLLIKAMAKVLDERKDVTLIIIGKGNLKHSLQALCQELGLDKVKFVGYVSNEDLPKYYSAADLFVLPSLTREEAFGIVLAEAASCGAVPICFDIPGPGEVCRDLGGLVVPVSGGRDVQDNLAQAILHALTTDLHAQSKACQANAKKYAWSKVAQKVLETYRELIWE